MRNTVAYSAGQFDVLTVERQTRSCGQLQLPQQIAVLSGGCLDRPWAHLVSRGTENTERLKQMAMAVRKGTIIIEECI